jgi:hypothetical protein
MSRLSGPAVEDKGLLELVGPFWSKIKSVSARSLKRSARTFLPKDPLNESTVLGCGAWGCVWQTSDKRFALKVSLDATEGPIVAQIMAKKGLHYSPGCVYYHRIWKFPDLFYTNTYGMAPAYVILREEVGKVHWLNENGDIRDKYRKIHDDLEELPDAACDLVRARADLEFCKTIKCADDYAKAERAFMEYVIDLRGTKARHVGTFMAEAYESGVLLGDIHPGNVGVRRHNLSKFGVKGHRQMVVSDVGDEGQAVCPIDQHARVRTLNNDYGDPLRFRGGPPFPLYPRHPDNLSYWINRIPTL